ncbi:uncharacterized protein [Chiloscyllium punctatum]|uniref:uncharacterized protein n=1 Tax=Chiloscyllium punctatum TaxID=137246 RepID=UPI003B636846
MKTRNASESRILAEPLQGLGSRGLGERRQQQLESHSDRWATEVPGAGETASIRDLTSSATLKDQLLFSCSERADHPDSVAGMINWVTEIFKMREHNGGPSPFTECPLLSSKNEQLLRSPFSLLSSSERNWTIPPSDRQLFYRPERTHKYLSASVYGSTVYDLTEKDRIRNRATDIQLGRPTRSSLLRAKYCSLSTFSDQRSREKEQRSCDFSAIRCHQYMKALKPVPNFSGENIHSFLIGARYNRTNYLDSKAVERHGLFICRNKPYIHFIVDHGKEQNKKMHTQEVSKLQEEPIVQCKQSISAKYISENDVPPAPEIDRFNNKVKVPRGISTKKANGEIHMSNECSRCQFTHLFSLEKLSTGTAEELIN